MASRARRVGSSEEVPTGVAGLIARAKRLIAWFQATRVGRLLARYGAVRGAHLAGGIAYAGLFSVFSAVALAFTVFLRFMGGSSELLDAVVKQIDVVLPGLVDTGSGGMLTPDQLVLPEGLTLTTAIAGATLLVSALGVMGSLGSAIRAVFGIVSPPGNVVVTKLRDLLGFVLLASATVVTAALGIAVSVAASWVARVLHLGEDQGGLLVRVGGVVAAFVVDASVMAALMRVLAGARPLARDLWSGAAIGAVGTGVLRVLGTSLVGGASRNALLASFAAIVTLLLWLNLAARIMLYVAAWTANPPQAPPSVEASSLHAGERPNYVTLSVPRTLAWDHDARTGAVLASEATRIAREDEARERNAQRRELALDLATRPGAEAGAGAGSGAGDRIAEGAAAKERSSASKQRSSVTLFRRLWNRGRR